MNMRMTLDEKKQVVSSILNEAMVIQKTNHVYIPTAYFSPENLGFSTPRDIFRLLREDGSIKKIEQCWGYDEIEKTTRTFRKTSSEKSVTDEDYPVYEIEINKLKFIYQPISNNRKAQREEVEFDALNGNISYGKISYTFQKARKNHLRINLFKALWDERKILKDGKLKRKGTPLPPETVATRLEFIDSPKDFTKNLHVKNKVNELIKNVEINLQRKKLPVRIYKKGGLQIVIETK